jgi:short-subunit dehydrogenase
MKEEFYTLITGASRGIGKAISNEMASRGHNLILNSLPGDGLENICAGLIDKYKIKAYYFEIDLTADDGPEKLFRMAETSMLKVNILINNAGTGIEGPLESYSQREIDTIIFLNIRALTLLTFFFAPDLKETPSYVLNISSFGCYIPAAYKSVYLASKAYIYFFTRALESEFKGTSVRTCMLLPSAVRTNEKVLKRIESAGWTAKASLLEPEEVASIGLKGMFKGRKVIIPGRFNRFVFTIGLFLPEGIIMAVIRNIFKRENSL